MHDICAHKQLKIITRCVQRDAIIQYCFLCFTRPVFHRIYLYTRISFYLFSIFLFLLFIFLNWAHSLIVHLFTLNAVYVFFKKKKKIFINQCSLLLRCLKKNFFLFSFSFYQKERKVYSWNAHRRRRKQKSGKKERQERDDEKKKKKIENQNEQSIKEEILVSLN